MRFSKLASSGNSSQLASSGYSHSPPVRDIPKVTSSGREINHSLPVRDISASPIQREIHADCHNGVIRWCTVFTAESRARRAAGLTLAEWRLDYSKSRFVPVCVKTAQIDGEVLKENTWYTLENGEFVECE